MAAESMKQNNEFLVQPTTNSNQTKATLNHLLTQPVSQLSTNLQQNRPMTSPLLPPNMSPFNPAARQRETTPNYSPKLTNDLSSQVPPRTSNLNGFFFRLSIDPIEFFFFFSEFHQRDQFSSRYFT